MNNTKEYATAIHEAGHAVMYITVGKLLSKVTIIEDDLGLGHCLPAYTTPASSEDDLIDKILILAGGTIAEEVILDSNASVRAAEENDYANDDSWHHWNLISNYFKGNNEDEDTFNKKIMTYIRIKLNNSLVQQQIKTVADALMTYKTLTGEQVEKIMKRIETKEQ